MYHQCLVLDLILMSSTIALMYFFAVYRTSMMITYAFVLFYGLIICVIVFFMSIVSKQYDQFKFYFECLWMNKV